MRKHALKIMTGVTISLFLTCCFFVLKPEKTLFLRSLLKEAISPYKAKEIVQKIKKDINETTPQNKTELIDRIRTYIHDNSCHKEFTPYHAQVATYLDKRFQVLEDIYNFKHGNSFKPELSCTPRSWAMQEIVRSYDIPFRVINLYFTEERKNQLTSHTFLEVYNTDTKKWEIHDPDANIFYTDSLGNRLSSLEIMHTQDKTKIVVCKTASDCCDDKYRIWLSYRQAFKAIKYGYLGYYYNKNDLLIIDDDYYDLNQIPSNKKVKLLDNFINTDVIVY